MSLPVAEKIKPRLSLRDGGPGLETADREAGLRSQGGGLLLPR